MTNLTDPDTTTVRYKMPLDTKVKMYICADSGIINVCADQLFTEINGKRFNSSPNFEKIIRKLFSAKKSNRHNQINVRAVFHTHPANAADSDRTNASKQDKESKESTQRSFPEINKFIILTKGFSPIQY